MSGFDTLSRAASALWAAIVVEVGAEKMVRKVVELMKKVQ